MPPASAVNCTFTPQVKKEMLTAQDFVEAARKLGFGFYAGVPCSFLNPFINYVIDDPDLVYVSSANEGDALATASGAALAGQRSVAMMQNSGLGNAVSPLTSLTYIFHIPILVICTHRGAANVKDEPQHELMGQITTSLFETMRIPWATFPSEPAIVGSVVEQMDATMRESALPYSLVMQKGTVAPHTLNRNPIEVRATSTNEIQRFWTGGIPTHKRSVAIEKIVELTPIENTVVIATTGFTGRELYATCDRANHLYMVGSMGCASSLGLGLALARPDLHVVVVDGDGAGLMRMGNLATLGSYGGGNLTHILLDNQAHDSTGAQATVAGNVSFAAIAKACGYDNCFEGDQTELLDALFASPFGERPRFGHLKISAGTIENLPRPSVSPPEVLARLMEHIGSTF